jgi:hypothetical protein
MQFAARRADGVPPAPTHASLKAARDAAGAAQAADAAGAVAR